MSYIAIKACKFAGQKFRIGETVPDEVIQPGAAKNLIKMQIITPADASSSNPKGYPVPLPPIGITIHAEEGDLPLEVTCLGIQQVVDALTTKADNAEAIVEVMEDGDALILLDILDSRKTIKAAAKARATILNAETEEEQEEESEETPNGEESEEEQEEAAEGEKVEEPEEEPEESAGEE